LSRDRINTDLTPSICEEALERFRRSEDSFVGVLEENHVEVRDFMVLSFVCDQNGLGIEQLMSALGMSHQSVSDCVDRLVDAGLSAWRNGKDGSSMPADVVPTGAGRKLARRVLGD
jgi:DNA-binding MarR family transcriptional regulator